jgi:hypothetical protein
VTAEFSYESDYGADADGNRGRATWWLDGWEIEGATYLGESTPVNSEIEKAVEDTIGDIHFDL